MNRLVLVLMAALPCVLFLGCGYFSASGEAPPAAGVETMPAAEVAAAQPEEAAAAVETKAAEPQLFEPGAFEDPEVCSTCHGKIYDDWSRSMHANAWQNQWYQPDFLLAHQETDGATDLLCGACHAPIAARTGLLPPADGSKFDATSRRGISCDFCHTVTGVEQMFNMGHVSEPGNVKTGPRGDGNSLYHEVKYTEIHTKADFCGSCHMVIHPATGVHIIDTWEDWKSNEYGKQNITCQDCHMTPTPGVSKTPGRAALMGKLRDNLAHHGFVGGSSYIQEALGNQEQAERSREFLRAAAELKLAEQVSADGTLELTVEVHNVGAGHKIPTGTTYIREIWLQVEVKDQAGKVVYSSGHVDDQNHVDPNAVVFRVLFKDAEGNLTPKSWRAHGIGYDRRIPAKGKDSETYRIPLPAKGEYQVTTRLMYRSFTQQSLDEVYQRTGKKLPPVASAEMAAAKTTVRF
ncbi:c-type cytochrome [Desulfuromonas versatilis]|uniref:C-type cytochrome n=1 Tax=Desulfuromonas versatilis TaxID=2802975 RepID=A0ABM8I0F4_9BACT|nr:cytochrome c family protein [Desulfuromonas versatilis]BCR06480.1 c-type cytochrome [Desulfuromonas versatilis]